MYMAQPWTVHANYVWFNLQLGTPLEEVIDANNNQPNILFLKDDDDIDPCHQLFVAIEQKLDYLDFKCVLNCRFFVL